jgi:hypothetical protein
MLRDYWVKSNNCFPFGGARRRRRRQEHKGVSLPVFKFLRYFTPEGRVWGRRASSVSGSGLRITSWNIVIWWLSSTVLEQWRSFVGGIWKSGRRLCSSGGMVFAGLLRTFDATVGIFKQQRLFFAANLSRYKIGWAMKIQKLLRVNKVYSLGRSLKRRVEIIKCLLESRGNHGAFWL